MLQVVGNIVRQKNRTQTTAAAPTRDQTPVVGLIIRAEGGDFEAFGELYSLYLDRIYRYVFYQVKDRMTAEDITEEVFVKAWQAIGSCKGKEATFSAWLYRIAHNHMINTLRKKQKITSIETKNLVDASDPKIELETALDHQELLATIADLPQNQKEVIILKFIEEMDNREISKVLGKREGAIRILQMRALANLRQKLSSDVA